MKLEEYPKFTAILRGYSYQEAMKIIGILSEYNHKFCVEVTTNNDDYLRIIEDGNANFGNKIHIGVGTVLTLDHAKEAVSCGAKFMLGPTEFSKEIIEFAKQNNVITVPGVMSPTEIIRMKNLGADIFKIFPSSVVGPKFFKDVQAPLGKLNLMAVGGINADNTIDFLNGGANYVGIGSSLFNRKDLEDGNIENIKKSIENFINKI